jgi:hypothetical protein
MKDCRRDPYATCICCKPWPVPMESPSRYWPSGTPYWLKSYASEGPLLCQILCQKM